MTWHTTEIRPTPRYHFQKSMLVVVHPSSSPCWVGPPSQAEGITRPLINYFNRVQAPAGGGSTHKQGGTKFKVFVGTRRGYRRFGFAPCNLTCDGDTWWEFGQNKWRRHKKERLRKFKKSKPETRWSTSCDLIPCIGNGTRFLYRQKTSLKCMTHYQSTT